MIIFHLDCYWKRASILTMLEYYLMTDFLCLAWVGKGGRKGQLIARCRVRGVGTFKGRGDFSLEKENLLGHFKLGKLFPS